jgi:hypothetical protein
LHGQIGVHEQNRTFPRASTFQGNYDNTQLHEDKRCHLGTIRDTRGLPKHFVTNYQEELLIDNPPNVILDFNVKTSYTNSHFDEAGCPVNKGNEVQTNRGKDNIKEAPKTTWNAERVPTLTEDHGDSPRKPIPRPSR